MGEDKHLYSGVEPLLLWQSSGDARKLAGSMVHVANLQDLAILDVFIASQTTVEDAHKIYLDNHHQQPPSPDACAAAVSPEEEAVHADFKLRGIILASSAGPLLWMDQLAHMKFEEIRLVGTRTSNGSLAIRTYAGSLVRLLTSIFPCVFASHHIDRTLSIEAFARHV